MACGKYHRPLFIVLCVAHVYTCEILFSPEGFQVEFVTQVRIEGCVAEFFGGISEFIAGTPPDQRHIHLADCLLRDIAQTGAKGS